MELYKKNRPKKFSQIIGNETTIKSIQAKIDKGDFPHFVLLTGPSGCGKTTIARILCRELKCGQDDFLEFNCANRNGVELAREIERDYRKKPIGGGVRIYYLDECHALTKACESSLLKPLEDTPEHCYFIFATTDPQQILPTIKTRATEYKLSGLSQKQIFELLDRTCQKEIERTISDDIKNDIFDCCGGSARLAMVLLDKIIDLSDDDMKVELELAKASEVAAYEILRALMGWGVSGWSAVAKALANNIEDPESIRRYLRASAMNQLVDPAKAKNHARSFEILQCTEPLFYDKPALVQACYDIINGGK